MGEVRQVLGHVLDLVMGTLQQVVLPLHESNQSKPACDHSNHHEREGSVEVRQSCMILGNEIGNVLVCAAHEIRQDRCDWLKNCSCLSSRTRLFNLVDEWL